MFLEIKDQLQRIEASLGSVRDPEISIEQLKNDSDVANFEESLRKKATMETMVITVFIRFS